MKKWLGIWAAGMIAWSAGAETHTNLQAVTAMGASAWAGAHPFTIRGILLNNPEEMLDSAWDAEAESLNRMGGQWQLFIQAADAGDRGGTALWMGQNYSSVGPWVPAGNFYDEAQWSNEMLRLNYDTHSMHHFRAGDLVEVTANQSLFYGGKRNINEAHRTNSANNFYISLVEPAWGLPEPEVITVSTLVTDGTNQIFDATRQTGGEYYQGARVRLEGLRWATNYFSTNGWGKSVWADRRCTVTDGAGRFFHLRMPLLDLGAMPSDWFSAVGLINQESGSGTDGRFGYELFVQEIGPDVRVLPNNGKAFVYWPATYTNYVLEYSTNLSQGGTWQAVENPPAKWLVVEDEAADANRQYRVRQRE